MPPMALGTSALWGPSGYACCRTMLRYRSVIRCAVFVSALLVSKLVPPCDKCVAGCMAGDTLHADVSSGSLP
jgi:hypothetical protein